MAGAATSAAFIKPNQTISTNIESLGSVNFEVAE
jgi:hypothetical protein